MKYLLPLIPREIPNDYTCFGVNTQSNPPISPVQSRPIIWNITKALWQSKGPAWGPAGKNLSLQNRAAGKKRAVY